MTVEYGGNLPRADFESHHIEGFAREAHDRGDPSYFNVPLITHAIDNLWVGGCIPGVKLPEDFDFVLSLYMWGKYILGPDTQRLEVKMHDSADMAGDQQLHDLADLVNDKLAEGKKVLVHCQAGLNRSNLISGLALIKQGKTPEEAIAILRKRSPMVLCNKAFEAWLLKQGKPNDD